MRPKLMIGLASALWILAYPLTALCATRSADETQIRALLDNWAKAMHDRDIVGIMSMYEPGPNLVVFDIVPPLRYLGFEAYKNDYVSFLAQYQGPVSVEYRDMQVVASSSVAFVTLLEHMSGTLTNGQKSEMWVRVTSGFRKIHGRWRDVHDHVSVPADFGTGKAMMDLTP